MGFWGTLFGGSKAATTAIEGGVDVLKKTGTLIDEAFHTDEEKAVQMAAAFSEHFEFMKTTLQENSTRSVTRRIMSWSIVGTVLFSFILSIVLDISAAIIREQAVKALIGLQGAELETMQVYVGMRGVYLEEASDNIVAIAKAWEIGWAFVAVIVFYFGIQMLRAKNGKG
mgnify:CR=1 FL=1